MRIVVVGAGAVGGTLAAKLHVSGHNVCVVTRGAHLETIRQHGLHFRTPVGDATVRLHAVEHPSEARIQSEDAVFVATQSQDTEWVARELDGAADPDCAIVCMQNGVENERTMLRRFGRVYGACVFLPATNLGPGAVASESHPVAGVIEIGRYPTGIDETVTELCGLLTGAGLSTVGERHVMAWKYAKLLDNLGNAVEAAAGSSAVASRLLTAARSEAIACYAAAGIDCVSADEFATRHRSQVRIEPVGEHSREGGSTWQSLQRRTNRVESDWLNGEIVLLGRAHNVPTPANELLRRLVNQMARERKGPASIRVEELAQLLDNGP